MSSLEKTENTAVKAASEPAEAQMHKPPSVLWLLIPLVLIMLYAAFSR
jgi:hypothetical protein